MNQNDAVEYIEKMFNAIWRHFDSEQLASYFSTAVIGRSGDILLNFDDIKLNILNLSKKYREIIPDFKRILVSQNQIMVWLVQHFIGFDGEEHLCVETMAMYEVKNGKIIEFNCIWSIGTDLFYNEKTHPQKFLSESINKLEKYHLTKRELDVLYYLIRHFKPKDIARILDISPRTVELYIQTIKNKLNVEGTNKIVEFAIAEGYTRPIPELMDLALKKGLIKTLKH